MNISLQRLQNTVLSLCVFVLLTALSVDSQTNAPSYNLEKVLFVDNSETLDRDHDGLQDALEYTLADKFKPLIYFDSDEIARKDGEPKVLFQVRPEGCIGEGCPFKPWTVWIAYSFLFRKDGGYGPASACQGAFDADHDGDNDRLRIKLVSDDGLKWTISRVENSHAQKKDKENFVWPGAPNVEFDQTHVKIYMSASKHHQYFNTNYDGKNSAYTSGGCNEDVNGREENTPSRPNPVLPYLKSTLRDQRPSNVGEPGSLNHKPAYFINDLSIYGFPPWRRAGTYGDPVEQNAWGGEFYRTGTAMKDVWMYHNFSLGEKFCIYDVAGPPVGSRITVTFLNVKRLPGFSDVPSDLFKFDVLVEDQSRSYTMTIGNNATVPITGNTNVTVNLSPCQILNLKLLVRDSNNSQIGIPREIKIDKAMNLSQTKKRTAEIMVLTDFEPDKPAREKKLFEVEYRITVSNIPNDKRRS